MVYLWIFLSLVEKLIYISSDINIHLLFLTTLLKSLNNSLSSQRQSGLMPKNNNKQLHFEEQTHSLHWYQEIFFREHVMLVQKCIRIIFLNSQKVHLLTHFLLLRMFYSRLKNKFNQIVKLISFKYPRLSHVNKVHKCSSFRS